MSKRKITSKQLVEAAEKEIEVLTLAEALKLVEDDAVQFLDIREPQELKRVGHVKGVINFPRGCLEFFSDPESDVYKPVFDSGKKFVLYCKTGGRSALAAKMLKDSGLENVAHMKDGFEGWIAAGYPVDHDPVPENP